MTIAGQDSPRAIVNSLTRPAAAVAPERWVGCPLSTAAIAGTERWVGCPELPVRETRGSPPLVVSGMTGWTGCVASELAVPQWSPLVVSGMTRAQVVHGHAHQVAAMEPAPGERDDDPPRARPGLGAAAAMEPARGERDDSSPKDPGYVKDHELTLPYLPRRTRHLRT